jgi:RNA polymerase sigma factor (sigma-70 family)
MKIFFNNPCPQAVPAWVHGFLRSDYGRSSRSRGLGFFLNSFLARSRILRETKELTLIGNETVAHAKLTSTDHILPGIASGTPRAMDLCITQYGGIVWSIVRRYVRESAEAEDVVQEVFTEVWKKAGSFDPAIASESTFIGMIARRRAIDFLRRQGRQPGFESLAAAESFPQPTAENASIVCDPETVKSSLANLPADTRQLFHLFFEDGFTHPEIAEKTGLPLGTVKTRLRRGLIVLREQLQRIGIANNQPAS